VTGKELVKLLQENGFVLDRIKGSHHLMTRGSVPFPFQSTASKICR
jgi:predicted RNA binding protein YcfA (HicA-like mRNA interferase family)